MSPNLSHETGDGPVIGLLSNGKHNAAGVLQWFGQRLSEDFGARVHFAEKQAPSGPAEEEIIDRLATYQAAVIGTAD